MAENKEKEISSDEDDEGTKNTVRPMEVKPKPIVYDIK